jgi:two-component system, chemotaxis family, protein-glutamate methylesterase/glutaminase
LPGHDIIVIGTSAGGVEALSRLVSGLSPNLPASLFVVMHMPAHAPSALPQILARAAALPAEHPTDGEDIAPGRIYVAPPGAHLLLEEGHMRLVAGPRENRHRPAIDPLFRSAALAYGPRVVGVVLTGALNDGTAGLLAIKRQGGVAVVQDPAEALAPGMPSSALAHVAIDKCLRLAEIPRYLEQIACESAAPLEDYPASDELRLEVAIAGLHPETRASGDLGRLSRYTCPDCKGPLWEIHDGQLLRFRCHVGHAFTDEALEDSQARTVEDALWTALETLEQRAAIVARLASRARKNGQTTVAKRFDAQLRDISAKTQTLRTLLLTGGLRESQSNEVEEPTSDAEQSVARG